MSSLKYTKTSENTVSVKGYKEEPNGNIVIPSHVKNEGKSYTVTAISEGAFSGCEHIDQVLLPETLEQIGEKAFAGCKGLTGIELPDSLKKIERMAFAWSGIRHINIPEETEYISSHAFAGCSDLLEIYAQGKQPAKITLDSFDQETYQKASLFVKASAMQTYKETELWNAFSNITSQTTINTSVVIDEIEANETEKKTVITSDMAYEITSDNTVKIKRVNPTLKGKLKINETFDYNNTQYTVNEIDKDALIGCKYLTHIKIPETVTNIEFGTFITCEALVSIIVSENNPSMLTEDGILYDKDKTILVTYPCDKQGDTFEVPSGINSIGHGAFANVKHLKRISFPLTTDFIGIQSFYHCCELESLSIGGNISKIGNGAFWHCKNLKTIYVTVDRKISLKNVFDDYTQANATIFVSSLRSVDKEQLGNFAHIKECEITTENGITYLQSAPDKFCVYRCDEDKKGKAEIPSTINLDSTYYQVNIITRKTFANCKKITEVEIADGITQIEEDTFYKCDKIESIKLPNTLKEIGACAFSGCKKLTNIFIPKSTVIIGSSPFNNCKNLIEINVEEDNQEFTSIDGVLYHRAGILVSYPAGKRDKKFCIPKEIGNIVNNVFADCKYINAIEVEDGNEDYAAINGVLYDKNIDTLIAYPRGKKNIEYILPASITKIAPTAIRYNNYIKYIVMPEGVKELGFACLANCENLEEVNLPDSIEEIDEHCMLGCRSLKHIQLPKNLKTLKSSCFSACLSLEDVKLNDKLEEICSFALSNCPSLQNITIPASVTSMGEYIFFDSFEHKEEAFNSKYIYIKGENFPNCEDNTFSENEQENVTLFLDSEEELVSGNTTVMNFEHIAFGDPERKKRQQRISIDGIQYLTTSYTTLSVIGVKEKDATFVTIPGTIFRKDEMYLVTEIGDYAMRDSMVKQIIFKDVDSIKRIGNYSFSNCTELRSINLPSNAKEIGDGAFCNCTGLCSVFMPVQLNKLGESVFSGCTSLTGLYIPNDVKKISSRCFYGCINLEAIRINGQAEVIGESAFENCIHLHSIEFDNTNTANKLDIQTNAFRNCRIEYLYLPNRTSDIEEKAFQNCTDLILVSKPAATRIKNDSFSGCVNLKKLENRH